MTGIIARAKMTGKIYRDALETDQRTLEEKANDDALMIKRNQINESLSVNDSFQFISEMDTATNQWDTINKWKPMADLIKAIGKARSHSGISIHKLGIALDAAREAGWIVEHEGWLKYQIYWSGE